eukprot:CAMPEP_0183349284 /NCGR_PEP_ID=MMETSP0164_2-20130417/13515_1 /TAXON_ID=221442 /ORGANISM="Coccolithus pelagicus ssp braarudi, Strain PLY182g" /LENGTH=526 /DNA_ID=CAMNT_0025520981 /DNA_START=88 /DNA_END=1668 /DNA_ORIENTATION=+
MTGVDMWTAPAPPGGFVWGYDTGTITDTDDQWLQTGTVESTSSHMATPPAAEASDTVHSWHDLGIMLSDEAEAADPTQPAPGVSQFYVVPTDEQVHVDLAQQKANYESGAESGMQTEETTSGQQASSSSPPTLASLLHVVVSVDWEGSSFDPENLAAFRQFRADFPNVPLTHFLNAAYFTKLAPDDVIGAVSASDKISSVIRDCDEIGLHIHADNHLLHAAGVVSKKYPSWTNLPDVTGHSVHLNAFEEEEVRQVVAFSCRTLVQFGFDRPRAFRAGGWHAGSSVLDALAVEGFAVDSSEVPQDWLPRNFGDVPELWPNATSVSQPYRIRGGLVEVPNNGCLADYVSSDEMVDNFKAVVRSGRGEPVVLALGFHQETAARFLPRLRSALLEIELRADMMRIPVAYDRMKDVALTVEANDELEAECEAGVEKVCDVLARVESAKRRWRARPDAPRPTPGAARAAVKGESSDLNLSAEEIAKRAWLARQAVEPSWIARKAAAGAQVARGGEESMSEEEKAKQRWLARA